MSQLEEAVAHDLGTAPLAPPVEKLYRRARRRRAQRMGAALVPAAAIVLAVGVAVHAAQPTRSVRVAPAAGSTSTTAPETSPTTTGKSSASLPYATEEQFSGLSDVMKQVRDYEANIGPISSAEIVATTVDRTRALFGDSGVVETTPIYLIRLTGSFICRVCSEPLHAASPRGSEILFTHARSSDTALNFSVGDRHTDLADFGRVYRLQRIAQLPVGSSKFENRTVTLTPDSALADGQTISVTVTGFGVGDRVWLSECATADDANPLGCGPQLLEPSLKIGGEGRSGPHPFIIRDRAPFAPGQLTELHKCSDCVVVATTGDDGYVFAPVTIKR